MIDDLIISISSPPFPIAPRHELRRAAATGGASSQLTLMSDTYMKHVPQSLPRSGEAGLESQDHDLSNEPPSPADGLVGMYRHKTAVCALLDLESKDTVRTICSATQVRCQLKFLSRTISLSLLICISKWSIVPGKWFKILIKFLWFHSIHILGIVIYVSYF
ncbi:BnaCnng24760D [Brassica napus]|uniref:BnaCnng24760D protein n=1 Tax=Brassica napus TaxID=3708 RepID=A0A078ITX7_BRANA|nr:BnaCnng24760D [Brassica napus]